MHIYSNSPYKGIALLVKVTIADIKASNGVIHVIDAVILLPEPEPPLSKDELCDLCESSYTNVVGITEECDEARRNTREWYYVVDYVDQYYGSDVCNDDDDYTNVTVPCKQLTFEEYLGCGWVESSKDEICDLCESSNTNEVGATKECYEAASNVTWEDFYLDGFTRKLDHDACDDFDFDYTNVTVPCKKDKFAFLGCSWALFSRDEACDLCESSNTNEVGITKECDEALNHIDESFIFGRKLDHDGCVGEDGSEVWFKDLDYTNLPVPCKKQAFEYVRCSWAGISKDELCDLCESSNTNEVGITEECDEAVDNVLRFSDGTEDGFFSIACDYYLVYPPDITNATVPCKNGIFEFFGCSWPIENATSPATEESDVSDATSPAFQLMVGSALASVVVGFALL